MALVFAGDVALRGHYISVFSQTSLAGAGETHEVSYLGEHIDPLTYLSCVAMEILATRRHSRRSLKAIKNPNELQCHGSALHVWSYVRPPKKGQEHLALTSLQAGRLTQQFIVDANGKIENERNHVPKIASDTPRTPEDNLNIAQNVSPTL